MKKTIIAIIGVVIVGVGIYYFTRSSSTDVINNDENKSGVTDDSNKNAVIKVVNKNESIIGKTVGGVDITAYHFGTGATELLLVGGIHGAYAWNTSLLAYNLADYFKSNPSTIPANLKITVIPLLNPDGLDKVAGTSSRSVLASMSTIKTSTVPGRFNGNEVDLNRNFDCDWQPNAMWQNKTVNAGTSVFSEPESKAVKNYIEKQNPKAVVVFYSAAGGVFSSNCGKGILPETATLTNTYAKASGYPAFEEFDAYSTTGDMVNWLAKINVPAISVLLTDHTNIELDKNLAGIKALIKYYTK